MGKKKIFDCVAYLMYLLLCIFARVILAKEISEETSNGVIKWLEAGAGAAKKWMEKLD